jgi:hypothetical protein
MSEIAKVTVLPKCDFCPAEAAYDGKTRMRIWANMCPDCMVDYGIGLGTGRGQRLVLDKPGT